MTAYVRIAPKGSAALPRWNGGRMPLSNTLADAMLEMLEQAERGVFSTPEMRCAQPLLALQDAWSALPTPSRLVAETLHTREGWHLYLYPLAGRLVHMGLAGLLAWRASQQVPNTFSIAVNDYGLELLSAKPVDWSALLPRLIGEGTPTTLGSGLEDEVLASLNATEMARRRFREIARIAGLIFQSHPGEQRSSRQLQASSSLYYDVFAQYDPDNLLLAQARAELLANELDMERLARTLRGMQAQTLSIHALDAPHPVCPAADGGALSRAPEHRDPGRPAGAHGAGAGEGGRRDHRHAPCRSIPWRQPTWPGTCPTEPPHPPAAHAEAALHDTPRHSAQTPRILSTTTASPRWVHPPPHHQPAPIPSPCPMAPPCGCCPSALCGGLPRAPPSWPTCTSARPPPSAAQASPCRMAPRRTTWRGSTVCWPLTGATHLVFLGDFLHARSGARDALWQQIAPWRAHHAAVQMTLVAGNHDQHAGAPPPGLNIAPAEEPWQPVAGTSVLACHHPQTVAGALVLAGHWHPTVTLQGLARDVMRVPCFASMPGQLVLPAFGAFTGMSSESMPSTAQRFAIVGDRVQAVPRGVRRR